MTENKRFTSDIHRIYDDKEQIACADTMDDAEILVDLLNGQEGLIKLLKEITEEQIETILKQKRKIKELTTQLQTEEESVCIKCKHHYLTKKNPLRDAISNGEIVPFSSPLTNIEPYYISKCKKGHVECSKEDIRYCEDFELTEDDENE